MPYMKSYIKSKRDVFAVVCIILAVVIIMAVGIVGGLLPAVLLLFFVSGSLLVTKAFMERSWSTNGIRFRTHLFTPAGEFKTCILCVARDGLNVYYSGGHSVHIGMEAISEIMFEDRRAAHLPMAGCGVDYEDASGGARLLFIQQGFGAVKKTRKMVAAITNAHNLWFEGCCVDKLAVHDVSAAYTRLRAGAVHRL